MRNSLRVSLGFLATTVAAACGPDPPPAAADAQAMLDEVVRTERAFAALATDSTVQHAFTTFIAPDAILFRPDPVAGTEALAARPMPADLALIWEPAWADVSAAGDLGYTTGPWRSGRRGTNPDSLPGAGQYVTLWRRTPEGFRFVLDIGIGHAPSFAVLPAQLERAGTPATAARSVATGSDQTREALLIADQDLGAALGDAGVVAWRAYADERVRVLRDGTGPAFGPDALIAASPPVSFRTFPAAAGVAASGDLGYTYGEVRGGGNAGGAVMGYYLRIWRRQADGSWKLALDLASGPPG